MNRGKLILSAIIFAVVLPVTVLMAQTGQQPELWAIDFTTSEGELTMWLSFDGRPSESEVDIKRVDYPDRYIVSMSPAVMSSELREGVVYQDILSSRSMGVESIDFTYDYAREKIAFTAVPWNGLKIDVAVRDDGVVLVTYRGAPGEDESGFSIEQPLPRIETTRENGDFENFFSLDKAKLHLSPEAEGVIRSYFSRKKNVEKVESEEDGVLFESAELQPASGNVARPSYQIQIGDRLALGVAGEPELDMSVQVRPDGYISFPIIGDVYIEGKTADEVRRVIKRMLQPYYNYDIVISLVITEFTPEKVYLLGKVYEAGAFPFRQGMTLLDLVGRYDERDSDIRGVKIIRGDEIHRVNMEELLAGNVRLNYELAPGDYIVFPVRILPKASVLGSVRYSNQWQFEEGQRLYDLIGMAGGFVERCDIKKILVMRLGDNGLETRVCNLLKYEKEGAVEENPLIKNGDVIIVPEVGRHDWNHVLRAVDSLNTFAYWWRWN